MSRYAVTIGSSHAYVQGLNCTLNALDYYGVKDIDVYVFSNKFMKEYFDYVKDKFNYPLYYIDAETLCPSEETHFADDGGVAWKDVMFFWGKYPLFHQLKDKYDAILHLDADMMLVDDISEYFKIAADSGNLLIAGNDRSVYPLSEVTNPQFHETPDKFLELCMGFPVLNYVFCFDAKKYIPLIDYVWALRNNNVKNTKHYGLETAYFVQGLHECNLLDKVVQLPFKHLIADNYLCRNPIPLEKDSQGKYHLIAPDGQNIKVVHGRFWNYSTSEHMIELSDPNVHSANSKEGFSNLLKNFENHTKLTDFLNFDCKSKIDEVLQLAPHYGGFLCKDRAWTKISRWLETPWPHGETV